MEESGRLGEGKGTFCALEVEEMYICMVSYVMVVVESDKLGDQGACALEVVEMCTCRVQTL